VSLIFDTLSTFRQRLKTWLFRKSYPDIIISTSSLYTYSQGNMEKFGGDLRWGREKVACWRTKVAISLKRVKI